MVNRNNTVPKLRFKDEQRSNFPCWKKTKLQDIAQINRGSGLSKSDLDATGKYSCILYGELYTRYKEVITEVFNRTHKLNKTLSHFGDILLPTSGETAEGVATASALLIADVQIGADIIVVRLQTDDAPVFVSYLLNTSKRQIMRLAAGASVSHIYPKDIASVGLSLPSSELEQHKIADFLSAVDEKIEQLEQKRELLERYKKGLMQKLFSQAWRFKDEQGREYPDWKSCELGELATVKTGSSNRVDSTLTGKYTFFDRSQDIRTSEVCTS